MLKGFLSFLNKKSNNEPPIQNVQFSPQKIYLYQPNQNELQKIIDSPFPDGKAPGYVYFVQEHLNGTFKIGKTKHIEKRMNVFGVKLPFKNELIYLIKTGDHHQTEVAFHKYFSQKRLEGEWFQLNQEDISWIKEQKYTTEICKSIHSLNIDEVKSKVKTNKVYLTPKQIEYAISMVNKLDRYELVINQAELTKKDLDRLIMYSKFKNKGTLVNMVKEGILKEKVTL
ncbi:GIY-YIG nuclease family protein [Fictibacillus sp. 18YEL24]|uniref:GIY-YIG nuclease family protein n=1 Tax=Fictibacillus sp. 18YEL24 TaxID=2745875 RepID=UPI0018CDF704|nr:GIY-YIG nuclease family protein [Fictibacillus sp. 18YEL24]MBH0168262.1 GIY-YIG nuclease family protein [Fictibacillus sp. 18YEL24]